MGGDLTERPHDCVHALSLTHGCVRCFRYISCCSSAEHCASRTQEIATPHAQRLVAVTKLNDVSISVSITGILEILVPEGRMYANSASGTGTHLVHIAKRCDVR